MIETTSGSVILHSYLNPQSSQPSRLQSARSHVNGRGILDQAREDFRPLSGTTEASSVNGLGSGTGTVGDALVNLVNGPRDAKEGDCDVETEGGECTLQPPPLLIATVVATSSEVGEARRAAATLERMGREFQKEWARAQEHEREILDDGGDGGDG